MDEDLKSVIEDLPVVSSVRFHAGDKTHNTDVCVNLRCSATSSHGGCDAKLVGSVRKSSKRPTFVDCLREPAQVMGKVRGMVSGLWFNTYHILAKISGSRST
jgi:hypothetical protein